MIVRELVAMFGLDFDRSSVREAEQSMSRVRDVLQDIGIGVGLGVAARSLHQMVEAASDVEESMNVVQQTFKESTGDVLTWANESGEAMGRSQFAMRDLAASFGAILAPMSKSRKEAADMSTTLSALAVDLGSFFNIKDEEAGQRLLSGILGETESVEKLGVTLKNAALEDFARTQGITKKLSKMTEQEKVELRYKKILKDTVDKQGDAIRTANSYANVMKKLDGRFRDFQVTMGSKLLGPMASFVSMLVDAADAMATVVKNSQFLEAAMITLGSLATVFGVRMALANLPLLLFIAGLAALALAINEIMVEMRDGETVIGKFFKALMGEEEWKKVKDNWKSGTLALGNYLWEAMNPEEAKRQRELGRKPTTLGDWVAPIFFNVAEEQAKFKSLEVPKDLQWKYKRGEALDVEHTTFSPGPPVDPTSFRRPRLRFDTTAEDLKTEAAANKRIAELAKKAAAEAVVVKSGPVLNAIYRSVHGRSTIGGGLTVNERGQLGYDLTRNTTNLNFYGPQPAATVREAERAAERIQEKANKKAEESKAVGKPAGGKK